MTSMRTAFRPRLPVAFAAAALLTSACVADSDDTATVENAPSSLAVTDDSTADGSADQQDENASSSTTAVPASSTSTAPSTTAAKNTTTTTSGGVFYDIGPVAGETLDVVGVRYDDVLNIRDQADASSAIVATAAPFAANPQLISGGEGLLFNPNGGAWWKVTVNGNAAWASASFLGQVSPNNEDLLPVLTANMPSTTSPNLNTLIIDIATALAAGPTPSVVLSTEPVGIDAIGSEATIDVLGIGDDSVKGWRIRILFNNVFDDINASNPQLVGVELVVADAFPICHRGLEASSGLCI